jgi:dihydroorotate dehydrogenase (fumarate)
MKLETSYLGLKLRSPLVVSPSPLSVDLENLLMMEEYGASAVVLDSLFAEQFEQSMENFFHSIEQGTHSFSEAHTFLPDLDVPKGPEAYLERIRRAKEALAIPVIASLNGTHPGNWMSYAKLIEQAGAAALELNIYDIPTDLNVSGADLEKRYLQIVKAVRDEIKIPLSVKIGPHFSSLGHFAKALVDHGANALTLFNRFYQPDLEIETFEITPHIILSTPQASRLPMRWIAILHGRLNCQLAASGGIHESHDIVKMIMAGADVTMLCSVLLKHGIFRLQKLEKGLVELMEKLEYTSVNQMRGCVSYKNCEDPSIYERALYIKGLKSFRPLH